MGKSTNDIKAGSQAGISQRTWETLVLVALAISNPALSRDDRRRQAYSIVASRLASKGDL